MNQKAFRVLVLVLQTVTFCGTAWATHNIPVKTKKMSLPLVRAYTKCASPTHFPGHNEPLVLPACSPVLELSPTFSLDEKGQGVISLQAGKEDIKLSVGIKGVLKNNSPFTGELTLNATVRLTDDNCVPDGPCTVIDSAAAAGIPVPCVEGTCKLKSTVNTHLSGYVTAGNEANIEIEQIYILDDTLAVFLRPGLVVQ